MRSGTRSGRRFIAVCVGLVLALGACTLPTPAPVEDTEPVVIQLEPDIPLDLPAEPEPEPEPEPIDPTQQRIDEAIGSMDLRSKLAGLMVVTISGMDPTVQQEFLEQVPAAGFLLLAGNLQGDVYTIRDFITALHANSDFPLVIAVDQEGNPVARIPGDEFGSTGLRRRRYRNNRGSVPRPSATRRSRRCQRQFRSRCRCESGFWRLYPLSLVFD